MPENGWAMVWRRSDQYCRLQHGIKSRKRKEKKRPVQSNLSPSFFRFLVERYAVAQAGRRTLFFIFRYNSVGGILFRLCRSRTEEDRVSKKKRGRM